MLPILLVVDLFQALVIDQPLPGAAATSAINIPLMAALASAWRRSSAGAVR